MSFGVAKVINEGCKSQDTTCWKSEWSLKWKSFRDLPTLYHSHVSKSPTPEVFENGKEPTFRYRIRKEILLSRPHSQASTTESFLMSSSSWRQLFNGVERLDRREWQQPWLALYQTHKMAVVLLRTFMSS
jgi:hypothetical protein